jgi:biotin synthase-related radical SAM superfamily protein
MQLSENEKDLIEVIRTIECAHIEIYVQDFIPLTVKKMTENIKLPIKKTIIKK